MAEKSTQLIKPPRADFTKPIIDLGFVYRIHVSLYSPITHV
jgi:hypothetical protein